MTELTMARSLMVNSQAYLGSQEHYFRSATTANSYSKFDARVAGLVIEGHSY